MFVDMNDPEIQRTIENGHRNIDALYGINTSYPYSVYLEPNPSTKLVWHLESDAANIYDYSSMEKDIKCKIEEMTKEYNASINTNPVIIIE